MSFKLPKLTYLFDALEPYIDKTTMQIHYEKHHGTYVEKLNTALEGNNELLTVGIDELLKDLSKFPEDIRPSIRNNGGGHANHKLFWEVMSPDGGGKPTGRFMEFLKKTFGGLDEFKEKFSNNAISIFGSGWGWLVLKGNELDIMPTSNQDNPMMQGITPLFGIDVWEHAYYLKYQNRRKDYIESWWNIINWDFIEKRFTQVI